MGAFVPLLPIGSLNVALSNYAKAPRNAAAVGDSLAPRVPVPRQTFQYLIFDYSSQRIDFTGLRAAGAVPQSTRMTYGTGTYFCNSHALRSVIPFEQEQYSLGLGFSAKQMAVGKNMDKLLLEREVYIANLVTTLANVPNSATLSGTSMWDAYIGSSTYSDPVQQVQAALDVVRQSGVEANLFTLSTPVITALVNHPLMRDRFKYTNPTGDITLQQLSTAFGVKCQRAGMVSRDKNNVGGFVWGTNAVLSYAQDVASEDDLSSLKTFDWAAAPGTVSGYGVLEFPDPNLDAKADIVSVDWYWDTKIVAPETLFTFANCCAAPVFGAVPAPSLG